MKHLLNGVAIAAALAIAAPAWAQAPTTPAPKAAAPAMAAKPHKPMHKKSSGDQTTDQLNREELARLQGPATAAPPPPPPGFMGQPSPTQGIPGGGQPSASSHAASDAGLGPTPAVAKPASASSHLGQ